MILKTYFRLYVLFQLLVVIKVLFLPDTPFIPALKKGSSFEAYVSNEQPLVEKTKMSSSLLNTSFDTTAS